MKKLIKDLKNPHFNHKTLRVLLAPIALLNRRHRLAVRNFATKNWDLAPGLMHRLYWVANQ